MEPSPALNKFLCTVIRTTHLLCTAELLHQVRSVGLLLNQYWRAGMELLLHLALAIPGTAPLEPPWLSTSQLEDTLGQSDPKESKALTC